jgi:RNA polymerase sigma-70 factor (ECF subfamily)
MTRKLTETVKEAQQGRKDALEELYARFAPLVRAVAFDRTGDYSAAWDISQEVFLAMVKGIKRLKEPERAREWLMGITRRKAADFVKSRVKERERFQNLEEEMADHGSDSAQREVLRCLKGAVKALPEQERLAVELFHLERLPVSRIAEVTRLPRSTIYERLIRARATLRIFLEKLGFSEASS